MHCEAFGLLNQDGKLPPLEGLGLEEAWTRGSGEEEGSAG